MSITIHTSLFGNISFYVTTLCRNLSHTCSLPYNWVIHVDSTVSEQNRRILMSINPRVSIVDHEPHEKTKLGPLWRLEALRTASTGPAFITDADLSILGYLPIIEKFIRCKDAVWYHSGGQYVFYESKLRLGHLLINDRARNVCIDSVLDKLQTCPAEYIEMNKRAEHIRCKLDQEWYGYDEFVMSYQILPIWEKTIGNLLVCQQIWKEPHLDTRKSDRLTCKQFDLKDVSHLRLPSNACRRVIIKECQAHPEWVPALLDLIS